MKSIWEKIKTVQNFAESKNKFCCYSKFVGNESTVPISVTLISEYKYISHDLVYNLNSAY